MSWCWLYCAYQSGCQFCCPYLTCWMLWWLKLQFFTWSAVDDAVLACPSTDVIVLICHTVDVPIYPAIVLTYCAVDHTVLLDVLGAFDHSTPINKQTAWWSSCHSCPCCRSLPSCSWCCWLRPSRFSSGFVASSVPHFSVFSSFSLRFMLSRGVRGINSLPDEGLLRIPPFFRIVKKTAERSATPFCIRY